MCNRSSHNNFSTEDSKSSIKHPDYSISQSTEAKKAANLTGKSTNVKTTSVGHSKPNDRRVVQAPGQLLPCLKDTNSLSKYLLY